MAEFGYRHGLSKDGKFEAAKGMNVSLSPAETLIFHKALRQFSLEPANRGVDRMLASKICDEFEEKMRSLDKDEYVVSVS